jgi:hypothetical protein
MWTAVVENITSGSLKTPVFGGVMSGKEAFTAAKDKYSSTEYRVVCVVQGKNDQSIYSETHHPYLT